MKRISRENAVAPGIQSFKACSWNSKVFSCWKPRRMALWEEVGDDVDCKSSQMNQNDFSCNMKFSMELARSCCRPKQRPLLRSIFQSFIGLWVEIWHRNKAASCKSSLNRILCKAADLNRRPVWGRDVYSNSNLMAQRLQMTARKSLETTSGMIMIR